MKITIPNQKLIRALELIGRISTKHITLPVLQCVLFEVTQKNIVCKATNLEINIEVPIEGVVENEGVVAVPAQTLLQSVQFATTREVTLEKKEDTLVVVSGKNVTKINLQSTEEFPKIQKVDINGSEIDGNQFVAGVKTVAVAASQTSIKPELGSVFIQQKREHSLTFVATDSFRLMEKTVPQKNLVLDQTFMVPSKNALELARVIDSMGQNPVMVVTDTQCVLSFPDGVYISSRLVSGTFPDYQQIIPKEFSTHTTVVKQDFVTLLKKTQVFLNKFMQVTILVSGTELKASSQNGEVGTTEDIISASIEGEDITLNFNHRYLSEPLQHIHDDTVVLHFAGIGRPLVIEGVSDKNLRYLVMPMNR